MATMTEKQLGELLTALTLMTSVLTEVTMTPKASAPAKPKTAPKGRKAAPKKTAPKGRKTTGSKTRLARTANIVAFGEALGVNLEGWTLEGVLDSLREYGQVGDLEMVIVDGKAVFQHLPFQWAFGPASLRYLAKGEWS